MGKLFRCTDRRDTLSNHKVSRSGHDWRERDAIHVRNVTSRSFWQLPLRASSRDESNRGLSLPDLAISLVLDDITIGGCFYQSDERVRFTWLSFSLSLLFLLLFLSLPASRARREKKMRGSRSFIPRRMLRRNYHAAWSRCTRASVHTRPRHSNNCNVRVCVCVSQDLAVSGTFQINVSGSCRFAHTDSRWHLRSFPRLDIFSVKTSSSVKNSSNTSKPTSGKW